jgi:hypothetical protein
MVMLKPFKGLVIKYKTLIVNFQSKSITPIDAIGFHFEMF